MLYALYSGHNVVCLQLAGALAYVRTKPPLAGVLYFLPTFLRIIIVIDYTDDTATLSLGRTCGLALT